MQDGVDKNSLVMLGLKNSGKSSVAAALSQKLSIPCLDTDVLVSQAAGLRSAREVFNTLGKDEFQRLERDACRHIAARMFTERLVAATGGGIADNSAALDSLVVPPCFFVYLRQCKRVLFERFMQNGRPAFLPAEHPFAAWCSIYKHRDRRYLDVADFIIECSDRPVMEIVREVLENVKM